MKAAEIQEIPRRARYYKCYSFTKCITGNGFFPEAANVSITERVQDTSYLIDGLDNNERF
jgi:hypothetical protein